MNIIRLTSHEELHEMTEQFNNNNYQLMRSREIQLDECVLYETPYLMSIEPNWGDGKTYIRILVDRTIYFENKQITINDFL